MGEEEQQQDKRKLQREWGTSPAAPPPFVVVVSFSRLWLLRLQANKMARACKHLNLFANYAWQPQKRTRTGRQGDRQMWAAKKREKNRENSVWPRWQTRETRPHIETERVSERRLHARLVNVVANTDVDRDRDRHRDRDRQSFTDTD